jgi:hypothetical protein
MPILDVTPADLFAIVADGVPAEVRRHRIVAPNLTHNDELKVIQEYCIKLSFFLTHELKGNPRNCIKFCMHLTDDLKR